MDINSVSFSWMLIGEGPITNNINSNRVSVSPTTSNGSDFTNTLEFDFITEEDDGIYVCTVMILETDASEFVEIENFHGEWATYMYNKQTYCDAHFVMTNIKQLNICLHFYQQSASSDFGVRVLT